MTVTLTTNYKEIYSTQVVEKIDELIEDNFYLDDMLVFIDEYSEEDFLNYYEEYVNFGEDYTYEAVDAFIEEFGIENINSFGDAYHGMYETGAAFAEQYFDDMGYSIPDCVVVDWNETWERNFYYDFTISNGYVFGKNF